MIGDRARQARLGFHGMDGYSPRLQSTDPRWASAANSAPPDTGAWWWPPVATPATSIVLCTLLGRGLSTGDSQRGRAWVAGSAPELLERKKGTEKRMGSAASTPAAQRPKEAGPFPTHVPIQSMVGDDGVRALLGRIVWLEVDTIGFACLCV